MIAIERDLRSRAEARVIAALLADSGCIRHLPYLRPADFSHDLHGVAFACIRRLIEHDEAVNACSVMKALPTAPVEGDAVTWAGTFAYLLGLQTLQVVPSHVGYYASLMRGEGRL